MTDITLDLANRIIAQIVAAATDANGRPLAICVLNRDGHVVSMQRQDGASSFRNDIAAGKAWGAVAMGEGSRALAQKAKDNPAFVQALTVASGGRLIPNPGGVLIKTSDGLLLGAVGISGDSGARDEQFAVQGVTAVGLVPDTG